MKKILFILYTCCILLFPVSAQQIPSFKANDRIVFLGNSITEGGHYHSYIWLYYMTHFPELPLRIYNGGIVAIVQATWFFVSIQILKLKSQLIWFVPSE